LKNELFDKKIKIYQNVNEVIDVAVKTNAVDDDLMSKLRSSMYESRFLFEVNISESIEDTLLNAARLNTAALALSASPIGSNAYLNASSNQSTIFKWMVNQKDIFFKLVEPEMNLINKN